MLYDIKLRIQTRYATAAAGGRHVVCAMPRDLPGRQRLILGHLETDPPADERLTRIDFFGNSVTELSLARAHDRLDVSLRARVERLDDGAAPTGSVPLAEIEAAARANRQLDATAPQHFCGTTARVQITPEMSAYAQAQVAPGMSTVDAVQAVGMALHADMQFDPVATNVDTPAADAFAARRGVCQDYSHIMIACLRALGIPAGYVSGYLRTTPPPGKKRLEGADAMHAWVQAWCGPEAGWFGYDPTNACHIGENHIIAAFGRDYDDVAPIRGVLRGWGGQSSRQAVDVIPVEGG